MLCSAWLKSFCWANSQAEVRTSFDWLGRSFGDRSGWSIFLSRPIHPLWRTHDSSGESSASLPVGSIQRGLDKPWIPTLPAGREKELNSFKDDEEALKQGSQQTAQRVRIAKK